MSARKILTLLFLLFAFLENSVGQTFQEYASFYKNQDEVETGKLNFRIESMGFFQNNEYLGDFVNGYTLTGAMMRPKLTFSPVEGLYLETGAHFVKYNGKDQMQNVVPWFSLRYRLSDRFSVVTGNLDQNNEHGLLEQLWEPERIYTDKPEAGLQFLYRDQKLSAQTWVNWEQFIQQNDPYQERFTFGLTGNYKLYANESLSVGIPVQALFYHQGGEINVNPSGPRPRVQTHANFSGGWELAINTGERLKTLNLNGYWLGYDAVTKDSNTLPFDKGHAFLLEAGGQTRNSKISLSYWNAFQFIAPKGRLLYQSVSTGDPAFTEADRSVVSARYFFQKNITPDARIACQFDAYMDVPTGDLSYSYGFFVILNSDFLLKKF